MKILTLTAAVLGTLLATSAIAGDAQGCVWEAGKKICPPPHWGSNSERRPAPKVAKQSPAPCATCEPGEGKHHAADRPDTSEPGEGKHHESPASDAPDDD